MAGVIEDIEKLCNDVPNDPGLEVFVQIVSECGVDAIPAPVAYVPGDETTARSIQGDIVLKAGYDFKTFWFRKKDSNYECPDEGEEDAPKRVPKLTFYIPRISPITSQTLDSISGKYVIVKFRDKNYDVPRLLGEVGNGMYCKVKEQVNPKNGYILELTGEFTQAPYWYRGAT